MSATGKVRPRAIAMNAQAARNLPTSTWTSVTGSVSRSSAVPLRRSSAHRPIVAAGTNSRYTHGCQKKNGARSAWRRS